jgi:hypothetical protein
VESWQLTVTSRGAVSVGLEASTTVIVWVPLVELPQASVAFHVRTIVPEPLQPERLAESA